MKQKVDEYGVIRTPGKFEGCEHFTPWFYEKWINHTDVLVDNITNLPSACIKVVEADIEQFPELDDVEQITIEEALNGSVWIYYE